VVLGEWLMPGESAPVYPDWFTSSVKAIYDPAKQGMTNYDVIEAYVEDFTGWEYRDYRGTAKITNNAIVITNVVETNNIVEDAKEPYSDLTIRVTGVTEDKYLIVRQGRGRPETHIKKDGIYIFPNNNLYFGFAVNKTGDCNITITQLPTSILKDFSGNGNHAYLYGGKGKLNSGIGLYTYDYNSDRWSSTGRADYIITKKGFEFTNIIEDGGIIFALGSNIAKEGDKVKVKISGIPNGGRVYFGTWITATEDGEYLGTYAYDNNGNTTIGTLGCIGATITLEFIPDYPDQLCYDGKMYAVCYGFPILTDYTVMAERTWFENNGNRVFITKGNIWPNCAFVFEKINVSLDSETFSFSKSTRIDDLRSKSGVTYQTKQSYNGVPIAVGDSSDGDVLLIGGQKSGEYIGCHSAIIVADRSFTEEEINWLKENIYNIEI
jgi:hypothetical protein